MQKQELNNRDILSTNRLFHWSKVTIGNVLFTVVIIFLSFGNGYFKTGEIKHFACRNVFLLIAASRRLIYY